MSRHALDQCIRLTVATKLLRAPFFRVQVAMEGLLDFVQGVGQGSPAMKTLVSLEI